VSETGALACGGCGADAYDPCAEDCSWAASIEELDGTPPDALTKLAAAVHRLPYSGLIGPRGVGAPDHGEYDAEEYIERLADWMTEYQLLITAMVDDLMEQSKRCISMQIERDVLDGVIRRALEGRPE